MGELMVPELRFPEYKGEWRRGAVIELCSLITDCVNKTAPTVDQQTPYLMIRTSNVRAGKVDLSSTRFVSEETFQIWNRRGAPQKGDIIFTREAPVGEVGILEEDKQVFLGQRTLMYRADINYFSNYFLLYSFLTKSCRNQIKALSNGGTVAHVRVPDCNKIAITYPSVKEQRKIATFLKAIDKKIEIISQKKEQMELYKKGMMQKLFSQEIRFKDEDGHDYPDWEEKRAKELFASCSNKQHDGDLPILSASQEFGMVYRDGNGINIQSSATSVKSYKIVDIGDFVISLRSFQGGIEYSTIKGICSPAYIILKPKEAIVDFFFKQLFKKESFIERLSKTVVGIRDGKQISYEAFGGLKISYPSLPEQQKIADFLTGLDKKIESISKEQSQLETFKKGLLQKMFV